MRTFWYQNAVFYGIDVRRFKDTNGDGFGDFQGLIDSLDYLKDLGVKALWLLPFYDTPLLDNGYDVRDYYRIDPRVGTLADFTSLIRETRRRNIRVLIDLVMNHTSKEHPWFLASRRDPGSGYRNYYVWSKSPPLVPPGERPSFPGENDSVWTYDPVADAYYFHRFYDFQPDLQIADRDVQTEIRKVMDFWLSFGIDGFRVDAAPLMIEEKGLPSTDIKRPQHVLKDMNHFARKRNHDAILLGEANVPLKDLLLYFGGGQEMTMLFNFVADQHMFLAFARQNAVPMQDYLKKYLMPPQNCQWLNFLRNLDELTLDMLPPEQLKVVLDAFAPKEEMRIYGHGIRNRLAPLLNGDRRRMEMAFSLMFSLPGDPMIMYGDELGLGDNLSLPGRNAARTPMQWSTAKNAGFSTSDELIAPVVAEGPFAYTKVNVESEQADPGSFLNWVKALIAVRQECPETGIQRVELLQEQAQKEDSCVLLHVYPPLKGYSGNSALLLAHNFSSQPQTAALRADWDPSEKIQPLIGNAEVEGGEDKQIRLKLPAYGYQWMRVPCWGKKA